MTRHFWVLMHRYVGLAMTIFFVIVGLTGSIIAFKDELDLYLNADLLLVATREAPMLDPLTLREKAEANEPDMRVDAAPLYVESGRSLQFSLTPRVQNVAVKELVTLPGVLGAFSNEAGVPMIYLDPYTGEKIGERNLTNGLHGRKDIIWFIYRLHMMLALPANLAGLGARILGIVALLWTLDCFVSFFLTLPKPHRVHTATRKSWWARWAPAWWVKWYASAFRINFDLHRAFGLWTWMMLFIFAWSSVAFNLNEVYTPVMNTLFGAPQPELSTPALPSRSAPLENPKLGWAEARTRGRVLLSEKANKDGFAIKHETILVIDRNTERYTMCANTLLNAEDSQACVEFDADTGAVPPEEPMSGSHTHVMPTRLADTITGLIQELHMARIFGLPMKIFVCVMGLVITMLSVTGVYIWLKKRKARRLSFERRTSVGNNRLPTYEADQY
jgi:uncharacterized iron-regulated membrane protein